jgi:hypothetical protein
LSSSTTDGFSRRAQFHEEERGELNISSDTELPGTAVKFPFVIVVDEAYPLLAYLMRPFPKKILDR